MAIEKVFPWQTRVTIASSAVAFVSLVAFYFWLGVGDQAAALQDELVYKSQSIYMPVSETVFGNYLHSFVYSSVSACGEAAYLCTKGLNLVFYSLGHIAVLLTSSLLLGRPRSLFVTAISFLSPFYGYVYLFIPEAMYFAFLSWAVFFTAKSFSEAETLKRHSLIGWSMLFVVGLLLIKPHGLALIPVFAAAWAISSGATRLREVVTRLLILTASTLALRAGFGFILAGPRGASPVPQGYLPGANIGQMPWDTTLLGGQGSITASGAGLNSLLLAQNTALTLFAGLFVLGGLYLSLSTTITGRLRRNVLDLKAATSENLIVGFMLVLILSKIVLAFVFQNWLTISSEDHSTRVLLRYVEPLLPFILLLVMTKAEKSQTSGTTKKLAAIAVTALIVLAYLFGVDRFLEISIIDSVFLNSNQGAASLVYLLTYLSAILIVGFAKSGKLRVRATTAVLLAIGGLGLNQATHFQQNIVQSNLPGSDVARYVKELGPIGTLTIIGNDRNYLTQAKFMSQSQEINLGLAASGRIFNQAAVDGVSGQLILSSRNLISPDIRGYSVEYAEEGFVHIVPSAEGLRIPLQDSLDGQRVQVTSSFGISGNSLVATERNMSLLIDKPSHGLGPVNFKIAISLDSGVEDRNLKLRVGEDFAEIEMPADESPQLIEFAAYPISDQIQIHFGSSTLSLFDPVLGRANMVGLRLISFEMY
jgi:hypothetical protein